MQPVNPFAGLGLIGQTEMEAIRDVWIQSHARRRCCSHRCRWPAARRWPHLPRPLPPWRVHGRVAACVSTTDGQQEQLRCRASYDVDGAGDQLRLNLTCASDELSNSISQARSNTAAARSGVHGPKQATTRPEHFPGVRPAITSRLRHEATAFSANLSLTTHGGRQTVSIQPQGTNITSVSLALNRR